MTPIQQAIADISQTSRPDELLDNQAMLNQLLDVYQKRTARDMGEMVVSMAKQARRAVEAGKSDFVLSSYRESLATVLLDYLDEVTA